MADEPQVPKQPVDGLTKPPSDLQITNEHVSQLMDAANEILNNRPINKDNILRVAVSMYKAASSMVTLPKRLRQAAIVCAIENIIDRQQLSPAEKSSIDLLLETVIPEAINIVTDIKDGVLPIKNSCCIIV
jgi:hypothetical protein